MHIKITLVNWELVILGENVYIKMRLKYGVKNIAVDYVHF